ncbi:MAG: hypothetical protein RIM84_22980 [Alphaproteobacteria bacterium]
MSSGDRADDLEAAYELIAHALDEIGPARERLFLAKLVLALVHETGDLARVEAAIAMARRRLG